MTNNNDNKFVLRRMLFLELTGIFSLLLLVAAVFVLFSLSSVNLRTLIVLAVGFLIMFTFVVLSVKYTRRDLHLIHVLHSKRIYKYGRLLVYFIGAGMIAYSVILITQGGDFFTSVASMVESILVMVIGIWVIYYTYLIHFLIENEHLRHEHAKFGDYFWVIILPVCLTFGSTYYLITQKADAVTKGAADFEMQPSAVIAEFEANDSLARFKFIGKSIKFSSSVAEVSGDSSLLLKLNTGVEGFTANCDFDRSLAGKVSKVQEGDSVVLQCSCSGLLMPDEEMSLLAEKNLEFTRCNLLQHIVKK